MRCRGEHIRESWSLNYIVPNERDPPLVWKLDLLSLGNERKQSGGRDVNRQVPIMFRTLVVVYGFT